MTNPSNKGNGKTHAWILQHQNYDGPDCLFWPFALGLGYGRFSHNGTVYIGSRYMCELVNGPPPTPAHQAAHLCGNGRKGCLHPKHILWKTNGENQLDRRLHGTNNNAGKTKLKGVGKSKFTPEQDAQLRSLREDGATLLALAEMFGVTHSTIQYRLYGGSYGPRRERLTKAG